MINEWIGWLLWTLSRVKLYRKPWYSTGIHDGLTCGYGKLSDNGFWQYPVRALEEW